MILLSRAKLEHDLCTEFQLHIRPLQKLMYRAAKFFRGVVYQFPKAAIAKCNKLDGLNSREIPDEGVGRVGSFCSL